MGRLQIAPNVEISLSTSLQQSESLLDDTLIWEFD